MTCDCASRGGVHPRIPCDSVNDEHMECLHVSELTMPASLLALSGALSLCLSASLLQSPPPGRIFLSCLHEPTPVL